jgi:F-type H+-transporting ATPase subunit delta
MALAVASRYARALVDLVLRPGAGLEPHAAIDQIRGIETAIRSSAELRNVLLSPAVAPARKRAVIARLAASLGIAPLVRNFLFVVIDHRRTDLLDEIREAFETLVDERLGVVRADVTSARTLSPGQQRELQEQLSRLTGKQVRMEYAVDPNLLGGVSARIGSTIYDGSVRGQLDGLRRRLVSD